MRIPPVWQRDGEPRSLRSRLGIVSSDLEQRLHPKTVVEEVVVSSFFGATRLGRDQNPSSRQWEQARGLLDRMQLDSIRERCYGELSDGQRRRLLIARALVHHPKVLVLDEPSRALDLQACHQLLDILRGLIRGGTTVMQVTHRVDTIVPEMERVLFFDGGTIVKSGTPNELLREKELSELFKTPLEVVEDGSSGLTCLDRPALTFPERASGRALASRMKLAGAQQQEQLAGC